MGLIVPAEDVLLNVRALRASRPQRGLTFV